MEQAQQGIYVTGIDEQHFLEVSVVNFPVLWD